MAQVCNHYGIRLTRAGRVIDEKHNDNFMKVYQKGQLVLDEKIEDQVTINTEAKETIRDLFPNIPDNDLFQIIKTAFQLGDGKVGTADEIPLTRRATLSVVAHIRHGYTRYDKLLRRMAYNNARHEVEAETLKKLVEWRGDGTADSGAINDILDDVIVISDEEKSDDERPGVRQEYQNEVRVEELDGSAYWPAGARPLSPLRLVDDAPQGYRYVPETAYGYRPTEQEIAIRERNRAARWEQAKQEYRSTLTQAGPAYQRVVVREPSPVRHLVPSDAPYGRVIEREYLGPDRPDEIQVGGRVDIEVTSIPLSNSYRAGCANTSQVISRPPSAGYARPAHVRYEPIQGEAEYRPMYHAQSRPLSPVRVNNRRRSASPRTETIMPSIEGPNGAYSPSVVRTSGEVRYDGHHARPNNLYRERDDHRNGRSSPINIPQIQPSGFARSQHGPISQDHSPYLQPEAMQIINSGAEYINQPPVQQRVVVQGNDTRFHQNQTVRVNPFQERYIGSERRLEPLQTQTYRRLQDAQQATPPRRILEPISDPYSDSGPQRYREFLPVTESHFASSAPTTSQYLPERRIIYANPPEEYVTTTRYEPLR